MLDKDKMIGLLEEMLDLDEGALSEVTRLDDIDSWDSLAVISLIALIDEHVGKSITALQIKEFKTIKDVIDFMK